MPPEPPRRRDGDATRERLVAAAIDLYTSAGYLRTTTPALADRAGVAEGTIYRHFTGKEQLLNEAWRRAQRWALEQLAGLESDRLRRPPERLQLFARAIIEAAGREPGLIRMFLTTENTAFLDEQSRTLGRQVRDALVQVVAAGKADGLVRAGPAELWASVWLTIVGYAALRVAAGEWETDHAQLGLTLEAAWDAIASRDAPARSS
jgi:AcrR family transcriptional regulator